ncbi:MAG TPA: hypothetical protein VGA98_08880 [Allosphingosinicella sp.]
MIEVPAPTARVPVAGRAGWWLPAAALFLVAVSPARAADLVLDAATGPYVDALVNGVPLRLRVDFDHGRSLTLNPDAAARAGLGNGEGSWIQIIGPVRLRGRSTEMPVTLAGQTTRAKVNWQEVAVAADADGVVTPYLLPFDRVTLERRPAVGGEREMVFESRIHWNHGIHVPVRIGKRRIAARLSFHHPRTTAPAAAAAVIIEAQGGALEGARSHEEIGFGVKRPARPLRLERPLRIGDLAITRLMARSADYRGKHKLALPGAPVKDSEILVTGQRPSQDALYRITLGLDVLERCSAASYVRATGEIRLRCAAP